MLVNHVRQFYLCCVIKKRKTEKCYENVMSIMYIKDDISFHITSTPENISTQIIYFVFHRIVVFYFTYFSSCPKEMSR